KLQDGSRAARLELELDRARSLGYRILLAVLGLPAERVHEPVGRVELDELAGRDVASNHVDPVHATGPWLEPRSVPEPARQLFGVDQELPDRLGARVDRELSLDRRLSRRFHASPSPL